MATKNKKDILTNLSAQIYTNTTKDITADHVKSPFNDLINSMAVNITVAQLQADDNTATQPLVNITDSGLAGLFYLDTNDNTTADDGGAYCIVNSTGQRYKRRVERAINATWYGQPNYYFPDVATATTAIKAGTRFVGLEVTILDNGTLRTYWWSGGVADGNLVIKVAETFEWQFSPGDGQMYTPADGDTTAINPTLKGRKILSFFIGPAKTPQVLKPATLSITDTYGQWDNTTDANNPRMNLMNGAYATGTFYSIIYK